MKKKPSEWECCFKKGEFWYVGSPLAVDTCVKFDDVDKARAYWRGLLFKKRSLHQPELKEPNIAHKTAEPRKYSF